NTPTVPRTKPPGRSRDRPHRRTRQLHGVRPNRVQAPNVREGERGPHPPLRTPGPDTPTCASSTPANKSSTAHSFSPARAPSAAAPGVGSPPTPTRTVRRPMLVVKIELWPDGDHTRPHEVGRIGIANVSDLADTSDYVAVLRDDTGHENSLLIQGHQRAAGFW